MISISAAIICLILSLWFVYMLRLAVDMRDTSLTVCWTGCLAFFGLFAALYAGVVPL